MKRIVSLVLVCVVCLVTFAACSGSNAAAGDAPISVISREDGSGTRGAFIELVGILKEENGEKVDKTALTANIANNTATVVTSVVGDPNAIGYISMGSLDDSVKALKVDGVEATAANILAGTYKIARPFNIVTSSKASEPTADFISYVLSAEGQMVVEDSGYIALPDAPAYTAAGAAGKIVVSGSSSVSPLMEKLIEAYKALNADVEIELQTSDSTTGMTNAIDGICDIGMASRNLKDAEKEAGLTPIVIANDGIAVIVNKANAVETISKEQVAGIFMGEIVNWTEVA